MNRPLVLPTSESSSDISEEIVRDPYTLSGDGCQSLLPNRAQCQEASHCKEGYLDNQKGKRRRKLATYFSMIICIGVLFTSSASVESLPSPSRFTMCGIGGAIFLVGTIGLAFIGQDGASSEFGNTGGFLCPLVPYLPASCILLNTYLLINVRVGTWIRVSVWLIIGVLVYLFYGRTHSSLLDGSYVPLTQAENI